MKHVLVVTYSQSGQATRITKNVLQPLEADADITVHYHTVNTIPAFPFPWDGKTFFEAFPETYLEIPFELEPLTINESIDYDLVVIGYSIWYLTPSIPINSFMVSDAAKRLMKGKPVITIMGSRNMWVMAQEKMKRKIANNGGQLVGNIALVDKAYNLVSVLTILRWMLTGKQDPFWIFPASGVAAEEIKGSTKFGEVIRPFLKSEFTIKMQEELNQLGAVTIFPNLLLLEKRANGLFKFWANYIRKKGDFLAPERNLRVKIYRNYLFIGIFILSPLTTVVSWFYGLIFKKKIQKQVNYYSNNLYKIENSLNKT